MSEKNIKDTALKHRHIGFGLTSAQFLKVACNGFGDSYNCYPHAMTWFNEHLYIGTTRANLHYRGRWRAEQKAETLGEIWPVKIPEGGLFDIDLRAQIWRFNVETGKWKKVFTSPLVTGLDGFEVPLSIGFRSIISYKGKNDSVPALYIPTWGSHQTPESVMLRSADGENFEIVSEPGLGFPDPYQPRAVRAFYVFKDKLFASPAAGRKRAEPNFSGYTVIFVTDDPAGGKWELACDPCFGDPNNLTIFQLVAFNDYLYAGTGNLFDGFQIWKTEAEGPPPFNWKKIIDKGAFRGKYNQVSISMVPFGDFLYVGTAIQEGGWDHSNNIGPAPPELIRIGRDDSWELVAGEARTTPDGFKAPISGSGPGFDNPFAGYFWSLCEHDGWLYAGDSEWSLFIKYAKKERLPEKLRHMLRPKLIDKLIHDFGGFDLWRSRDGHNWSNVTRNGFGNCFNMGVRNMVSTKYGLFLGVANPFSPEVAVKRTAGWNYEHNHKGGLEIWLGSRDTGQEEKRDLRIPPYLTDISSRKKDLSKNEAQQETRRLAAHFFCGSDFRYYGFWNNNVTAIDNACENLLEELLAFLPAKEGKILDISCGCGAAAQYLTKYFPASQISGHTYDKEVLKACRKRNKEIAFACGISRLRNLKDCSFDFVIGVKEIGRPFAILSLLKHAYRVLNKGGRIVFFDSLNLTKNKKPGWKLFWNAEESIDSVEEYEKILTDLGFSDVEINDVSTQTLEGYRKYAARYFMERKLACDVDEKILQKAEQQFFLSHAQVNQSLLVSAVKGQEDA